MVQPHASNPMEHKWSKQKSITTMHIIDPAPRVRITAR